MDNYYFDLHSDIVTRQGKTCKKCKRSLVLADKIFTVNGVMYCGKCGELESKRNEVRRAVFGTEKKKKSDSLSLMRARANYDRIRKSGK